MNNQRIIEKKAIYIFVILSTIYCSAFAQFNNKKENGWILGLGTNTIIDSGESLQDFFNFERTYHFSTPFKISIEKKLNFNHGIEVRATTNNFVPPKKFNSGSLREEIGFFSIDASYKYHFLLKKSYNQPNKLFGYSTAGFGHSWYNRDLNGGNFTDVQFHIGAGVNYKIYQDIMLNFQLIGKLSTTEDIANNYVQMDFGVLIPISFTK